MPGVLQCLDARYVLTGANGTREVPRARLLRGRIFHQTRAGRDCHRAALRRSRRRSRLGYEKLKRKSETTRSPPPR
jgi:hypothetical protein